MKKLAVLTMTLTMLLAVQNSFAQPDTRPPSGIPTYGVPQWVDNIQNARQREADRLKRADEIANSASRPSPAKRGEALKIKKAAEAERRKTLEEINEKLSAPTEYYKKYAEFLKTKNTGVARLFPDKNCGEGLTVTVEELERCSNTAQIKGAGSLYSFRLNEMPDNLPLDLILLYVGLSDIHFVGDKLVVGTESTQDVIASVGEVNLDDVTLESESVKFLTSYKPSDTTSKLRLQKEIISKGVNANGYSYSSAATVKLNETYVLRSIAYYNYKFGKSFWNTDFLAAFKVVGQEKDGSVVILWKLLKRKDARDIKYE